MQIYLPIAELSVNIFAVLGLGALTGVLSGMFGVGGGFLMTPFLIFIGVSPAVAVATSANQIIASSVSGFISYWRKQNVDFKMGWFLLIGGMGGSSLGVGLFSWLKQSGQIDVIISLCYVLFLGLIGSLMAIESYRTLAGIPRRRNRVSEHAARWRDRLPWQTPFPRSKLQISALVPLGIGFFVGVMVSLMGIGGGFFLIPAMIYLIGMPGAVVVGTSLFQIIFITANVTLLQAITTHTVDIVLALLLLSGSVVGAQAGIKIGAKLPAEKLRMMLALLVLGVAARLGYGLLVPPENLYTIEMLP